jgi:hypothetical protein
MDFDTVFKIISLLLQFMVIPAIAVLWRLAQSINNLELKLYKEFVTHEQLQTKLAEADRTEELRLQLVRGGFHGEVQATKR